MSDVSPLTVVRAGPVTAPVVVFLHGFLGAADDWRDISDALGDAYHRVMIELPGHGGSLRRPDAASYTFAGACASIVAALDAYRLSHGVLVGYSMGGRLALQLALDHPQRWTGLVLESASPGLATEDERVTRRAADEAWAVRFEREPFLDVLKAWYGQAIFALRAPDEVRIQAMLERRQHNQPAELARAMRGMGVGHQPSLWTALATLQVPALLLAGEFDLAYVERSAAMQRLCPQAARAIVSSAGHNVHVDNTEGFLRELRGFLLTHRQA